MRITLDHPVIVSGSWHGGGVRHDLVRTPGEFEIAEYSGGEAPETIILGEEPGQRYRTIEGRHYLPVSDVHLGDDLVGTARNLLFRAEDRGIEPVSVATAREAARIKRDLPLTAGVQNQNQKHLLREKREGLSQASVDCMKAPRLRNWTWLSDATAFEIAYWHGEAAMVLSNLVLIDGIPHRRMAEPCLRLDVLFRNSVVTTPVYTRQVHRADPDLEGLHRMYADAVDCNGLHFSLCELDEMYDFAREVGWACDRLI